MEKEDKISACALEDGKMILAALSREFNGKTYYWLPSLLENKDEGLIGYHEDFNDFVKMVKSPENDYVMRNEITTI